MKEKIKDEELTGQTNDGADISPEDEKKAYKERARAEKERARNEKVEWNKNRKIKRGLKALHGRRLKNFLLWLTGVVSGLVLLAMTVFVAVGVVPIKTYFGAQSEEAVSPEISDKSLLGILLNINAYTQSYGTITQAFPIIDTELKKILLEFDSYVKINFDTISDVPFTDPEFSSKLMSSIKIVATIKSLGADTMLGDFADLPVFKDDEAIDPDTNLQYTVLTVDTSAANFDYRLYTYYDEATDKYLSASNEDATDWVAAIKDTETPLYYASLLNVPFSDLTQIVTERFGVVKIVDLIEVFSEGASDGFIGDVLGNMTISSAGSFDPGNIKISAFIDRYEADGVTETDVYKILRSILSVEEGEEIYVSDFNNEIDLSGIKVSLFIDRFEADGVTETDMYRLMRKLFGVPYGDEITLEHLSGGLSFDDLDISEFVDRYEEDGVTETAAYRLLRKISGVESGEITVADLESGLNNGINLSAFVDRYEEDGVTETQIYRIIRSAFGVSTSRDITLDDIGGPFEIQNILLIDFLEDDDSTLMKIIKSATGNDDINTITLADLATLNVEECEISLFISRSSYPDVYKILETVVVGDVDEFENPILDEDGHPIIRVKHLADFDIDSIKLESIIDRYEADGVTETDFFRILKYAVTGTGEGGAILISDLSSFSIDGIPIAEVVDPSSKLYAIISETVTGSGAGGEILVSDLTTSFDVTKINLSTLIEPGNNNVLNTLLEDNTVTLANLGDKINDLELQSVFEVECFTTDTTDAVIYDDPTMGRYKKVSDPDGDRYVLLGSGQTASEIYYISKKTQIWLFMCYDDDYNSDEVITSADFDSDGFALVYKPMHLTLGNLENKIIQASGQVKSATIRQLVSAGLMDANSSFEQNSLTYIYTLTINDALTH